MRAIRHAAALAFALGVQCITRGALAQSSTPPASPAPTSSSSAPPASAAPAASSIEAAHRATVHYESGRAYYASGRYRAAVNELEAAIHLDPSGYNLYYDLGLVYDRLGMIDPAIASFRHFLDHATDPRDREQGERILWRLRGAQREMAEIQSHHGVADALFWSVSVASLASLAVGGVATASALNARSSGHGDANALSVLAEVTFAGGAALAVTAVLLYAVRQTGPRNMPRCIARALSAGVNGVGFAF